MSKFKSDDESIDINELVHEKTQELLTDCFEKSIGYLDLLYIMSYFNENNDLRVTTTGAWVLDERIANAFCFGIDKVAQEASNGAEGMALVINFRWFQRLHPLLSILSHGYFEQDYQGNFFVMCFPPYNTFRFAIPQMNIAIPIQSLSLFESLKNFQKFYTAKAKLNEVNQLEVFSCSQDSYPIKSIRYLPEERSGGFLS